MEMSPGQLNDNFMEAGAKFFEVHSKSDVKNDEKFLILIIFIIYSAIILTIFLICFCLFFVFIFNRWKSLNEKDMEKATRRVPINPQNIIVPPPPPQQIDPKPLPLIHGECELPQSSLTSPETLKTKKPKIVYVTKTVDAQSKPCFVSDL